MASLDMGVWYSCLFVAEIYVSTTLVSNVCSHSFLCLRGTKKFPSRCSYALAV